MILRDSILYAHRLEASAVSTFLLRERRDDRGRRARPSPDERSRLHLLPLVSSVFQAIAEQIIANSAHKSQGTCHRIRKISVR